MEIFCKVINVFTVTFEQFNASLLNKSICFFYFLKKMTDPKLLNAKILSVLYICPLYHYKYDFFYHFTAVLVCFLFHDAVRITI